MSLKEIFCQDHVVESLCLAKASGREPHAYIFAGPEGVGKFTTAREWAKMLLCKSPAESQHEGKPFYDSCGQCESCRVFGADSHPDFHTISKELVVYTKDGKNKKPGIDMPIDVVREFLIEKAVIRPSLSDHTVFVMLEAERLNQYSQNAMLKTLEEPPAFCTIILVCTRLDRMLPTTQSRCRTVVFGSIREDIIIKKLQEAGVMTTEARYWARFSQGSLGVALTWSKLASEGANAYEIKKRTVEMLARLKIEDVVDAAEQLAKDASVLAGLWDKIDPDTSKSDLGRRATKGVMRMLCCILNDCMQLGVNKVDSLINSDQENLVRDLARRFDPEEAALKIEAVYKSMDWVGASVNEKLIFEELLFNLI